MNKRFLKKRKIKEISLTTLLYSLQRKKMLSKIFVFLAMIFASVLADRMYDEKFSQPMSEKDMTLGKTLVFIFFFLLLICFDSQVKHHFWRAIYLCYP
jgi:hypothetical protein